tara:strand:+ start:1011 stop:1880 length:870 start_codon:yes stop_codon:yes gene_type:complete
MKKDLIEELTIVIVAYNSNELLIKCLKNIEKFKVIIVDNGKNNKIFSKLELDNNKVKIISKNKNLGFPKGVNFAAKLINTPYFLILNADTFINEDSINELLTTCKNYKNCGAAAPFTDLDFDGYDLFPENGKSIIRNSKQQHINKSLINLKPDGEICVEIAKLGLMINLNNFTKVGMFSEKFFMFWEEVDLCKKFRKNNLSVIVNPKAKLVHNKKKSSKNDLITFVIKNFHTELSPLYYFNIKKNSKFLYVRILKYLFRTITYLLIFNLKNSLRNIIKLSANLSYIFRK